MNLTDYKFLRGARSDFRQTSGLTVNDERSTNRIKFLDGLRGIAILFVVLFHAYARYPSLVPYGDRFAYIYLFKFGWLGVELFFMISGFVILMTLEKCHNFIDFMLRRWNRLFPAMVLCSIVVFVSAKAFPSIFSARPAGAVHFLQLIPGLSFIQPKIIAILTGIQTDPIEGAFWSLFVEVKFYIIFGFLFFLIGEKATLFLISLLALIAGGSRYFDYRPLMAISNSTGIVYFGWFASGAIAFKYFQTKRMSLLACMAIITALAIYTTAEDVGSLIVSGIIVLIFYMPIIFKPSGSIFTNRFLLFFGFISYPLYLVHENMMVALIIKLPLLRHTLDGFFLPVVPILTVVVISYIVARFGENILRSRLRVVQTRLRQLLASLNYRRSGWIPSVSAESLPIIPGSHQTDR